MISGSHRNPRQELVVYGRPAAEAITETARHFGAHRLMVISTRTLSAPSPGGGRPVGRVLAGALGELCVGYYPGVSAHSPRESVIAAAEEARSVKADLLLAIGGGSVIDAAKVVQLCLWADLRAPEDLDPYRAGRGADRVDVAKVAPGVGMIAAPTTLSAAEFTSFAGVTDRARRVKESYAHSALAPRAVVLDPALTLETPAPLWFSTGLKAVDHAVEQLCSLVRAPLADALAAEGLGRLHAGLAAVKAKPGDLDARLECQFGMWLSMVGANAGRGIGASHAIGHTLGGSYGVPHGVTSCVMLPAVLKWNQASDAGRQGVVNAILGGRHATASEAIAALVRELELPADLKSVGVGEDQFQAIAEHTMHDAGVRSNPRPIRGPQDIIEILELARG